MRIPVLLLMLFSCITVCAQTAGKNLLNGTYILARAENNDFIFDYEDTVSTLRKAFQHQLKTHTGNKSFDSLKVVSRLRHNIEEVYVTTRFQITFDPNGTYKWKTWYYTHRMLTGTYVLNSEGNLITFTHYDAKLKKTDKMYFKLLSPISETIIVQSGSDGKNFKDGKMTLKKE
jgi:hypothetical protein